MVPLSHSNPDPNVYLRSTFLFTIEKGQIDWERKRENRKRWRSEATERAPISAAGIPESDTNLIWRGSKPYFSESLGLPRTRRGRG